MVDGKPFAPKDAETLKSEYLTDLGIEYEGNEEMVDKLVAKGLKDEEFKASLHADKKKHLESKEEYKKRMLAAGLDPETGEKLAKKLAGDGDTTHKNEGLTAKDIIALRDVHDEDVDYLLDEAKLRGKSISELKKDPYMQIILKTRAEERATAQAAATKITRTGNFGNNSEKLLSKVYNQEDMTEEEMKQAAKEFVNNLKAKK